MEIKAKHLKTFDEKSNGLLAFKKIESVYFETRLGIHTFFMREAIDVLILDNKNRVVVIKENLKPNRIFMWNIKYKRVVELPRGTISKKKITINSVLKLLLN